MSGGPPVWKIWDADNTTEPEATGTERAMCAAADGLARQGVTVILEDPHGRSVFVREVELWLRLALAFPESHWARPGAEDVRIPNDRL